MVTELALLVSRRHPPRAAGGRGGTGFRASGRSWVLALACVIGVAGGVVQDAVAQSGGGVGTAYGQGVFCLGQGIRLLGLAPDG